MTPTGLITAKLKAAIEAEGSTVPVESLLLQAFAGEPRRMPASGIVLTVHIQGQLAEPQPLYQFEAKAALVVAIDDDKTGEMFRHNYEILWRVFNRLARGDNCTALGDEDDDADGHVFAVDGFQLGNGVEPDFSEDDNGGTWATTFAATITGRAT